jgi:hypothetical protein
VGQVLENHPELLETFLSFGFTTLAQPAMRGTIARVVTLEQACRRMGVDQELFVRTLNERRACTLGSPRGPLVSLNLTPNST